MILAWIGKAQKMSSANTRSENARRFALCEQIRVPCQRRSGSAWSDPSPRGDQLALHSIYELTHRIVFTLMMRIIKNRETAEELTVDVFHDVWRRASTYDPANGSVVGWIMNQARCRAIDRLRYEQRKKRVNNGTESSPNGNAYEDPQTALQIDEQSHLLRKALDSLNPEERQAIEIAFFSELTYQEVAVQIESTARNNQVTNSFRTGQTAQRVRRKIGGHMSSIPEKRDEDHLETAALYALHVLSSSEIAVFEDHLSNCAECLREIETLRPTIDSFASWPTDVLRPPESLWKRLSQRISDESGAEPVSSPTRLPTKPQWKEVATEYLCKVLAVDAKTSRVTMLVRLAPGTDYPPHRHAGVEELHLLHGELLIDDTKLLRRRLHPGRGRKRRPPCLERDWLHVHSLHVYSRRNNLILVFPPHSIPSAERRLSSGDSINVDYLDRPASVAAVPFEPIRASRPFRPSSAYLPALKRSLNRERADRMKLCQHLTNCTNS